MTTPILSPTDDRKYRHLYLPNKLECLLVSDPVADKSAAAVSVNVGALQDPEERPGLAHFLEHMLFLGTEKFPNQNDYSAYISANGGMRNAFTALQETNYFFDIAPASFEGALDRFAQFFTAPLFTEECTEKEINAVDSENKKNLMQDMWRKYQLLRSSSKKGHPFGKFGTGNKETLTHPTIRQDLLAFYGKNYSANIMKLCIYGKEDIDTLEKWAKNLFSDVKNQELANEPIREYPFNSDSLKTFWKTVPIEDQDYIEYIWFIDSLKSQYRNNPGHYVSALVGHEGQNSLYSYLVDEGLALSLSASQSNTIEMFGDFRIRIKLTKKGLAEHTLVSKIVFAYMSMLRDHGVSKDHFEEFKTVLKMKFENKDKEKAVGYVQSLVGRMQLYPIEDIVQLPYLMEEFDPEFLKKLINSFKVDNLRIYLSSKSLEKDCNETEYWYGTKYSVAPIPQEIIEDFNKPNIGPSKSGKILELPPLNRYIPKNFDLVPAPQNPPLYPIKIISNEAIDVFYKQDVTFKRPKASIRFWIVSTNAGFGTNMEAHIFFRLWIHLLEESMKEFVYEATMASVSIALMEEAAGLRIVIDGFSDSMPVICKELFKYIQEFNPSLTKGRFEDKRQESIDAQKNVLKQPPYVQSVKKLDVVTIKGSSMWLPHQAISILERITFEDLLAFSEEFLTHVHMEALLIGNLSREISEEISTIAQKSVFAIKQNSKALPRELIPEIRRVNIPIGSAWFYESPSYVTDSGEKEKNSAILAQFQYERETPQTMVLIDVLANYMKDPCFDTLRTTEQLGYIASGYKSESRGVLSYQIMVQSAVKAPQFISQRILAFIELMRDKIKTISNETFEKFVESSRVRAAEADLSIAQEASRYSGVIANHTYQFNRRELFLEELKKIKKEDLIHLFEEIFFKYRRLIEVHIVSNEHSQENSTLKNKRIEEGNAKEIISPDWFKRRMPLYPDYYSML